MSENDSFIDEVAEEVRRDRLFALMRKYGWIAIAAVLLIVGGASWNEWRKAQAETAAQAFGDAILAATAGPDSSTRLAALNALSADSENQSPVLGFMIAADAEAAGKRDEAVKTLQAMADNATLADSYRDLAQLKLVMIAGDTMDRANRDSILASLSAAGAPYRTLAIEQQALILLSDGKTDEAAAILGNLVQDADATAGQQQRVQNLLLTLGKQSTEN